MATAEKSCLWSAELVSMRQGARRTWGREIALTGIAGPDSHRPCGSKLQAEIKRFSRKMGQTLRERCGISPSERMPMKLRCIVVTIAAALVVFVNGIVVEQISPGAADQPVEFGG